MEDKTSRLRQKSYDDAYIHHQAFAESILEFNLRINDTLSDGEGHESQYKHDLFLPTLLRFDHKDLPYDRSHSVQEPKSYENVSLDNRALFRIGYYNYLSPHSDARYWLSYTWDFKNTNEHPVTR